MIRAQGGAARSRLAALLLAAVFAAALALRLDGLNFGLPSLLDPDEGIFILTSLRLLRDHTLNPGWFGHPGTTTIYVMALIEISVYGLGHILGRFADVHAFGQAVYADPALIVVPMRAFIVACGMATIGLTYVVARQLFDCRIALIAVALLTVDPLHIRYSQIIRTDMHATVFVLLEILAALAVLRHGRRRDYLLAAAALGFACATKWPAVAGAVAVLGAAAIRWRRGDDPLPRIVGRLALFGAASVVALFVASPYVFLDWRTVVDNLHGEERPIHLGATGFGLLGNMAWYVTDPLAFGLGVVGLGLAAVGFWLGVRRSPGFAVTIAPVTAALFVMISGQALVWERWLVPLLPLLTIAVAIGLAAFLDAIRERLPTRLGDIIRGALVAATAVPLLINARAASAERATDTRTQATAWARDHIPAGDTVLIEHLAFDILRQPWRLLHPLGADGCIDAHAILTGQVRYSEIGSSRGHRPVVDLGTVDPAHAATCRTDWAITINWDRYRAEGTRFPAEVASYARLMHGGTLVATFRPIYGQIGGPIVRVVRFPSADRTQPKPSVPAAATRAA